MNATKGLAKFCQVNHWQKCLLHKVCITTAHTLSLIVRDALTVMKPNVDKVKGIVEYFHKSTIATERLKSAQRQMGMAELKLKQDCFTRWNSTLYMLQRILECKDAIISTLVLTNAPVDTLSQEEWQMLPETCSVLEPFEQVTVEISSERYSSLLILLLYLFNIIKDIPNVCNFLFFSYVTASKMLLLCKGL